MNVRFDIKNPDTIDIAYSAEAFNSSINSQLPNPSLGFSSSDTGSDLVTTLKKFIVLNSGGQYQCRPIILILVKRYSNAVDISDLISQIRHINGYVQVIESDSPSGGTDQQLIYELTAKTNGLHVFTQDLRIADIVDWSMNFINYPNLIFASNPTNVNGIEHLDLGSFETPDFVVFGDNNAFLQVSVQQLPLDDFKSLNITITDFSNGISKSVNITRDDLLPNPSTAYMGYLTLKKSTKYDVQMDYDDELVREEDLEIRISV